MAKNLSAQNARRAMTIDASKTQKHILPGVRAALIFYSHTLMCSVFHVCRSTATLSFLRASLSLCDLVRFDIMSIARDRTGLLQVG